MRVESADNRRSVWTEDFLPGYCPPVLLGSSGSGLHSPLQSTSSCPGLGGLPVWVPIRLHQPELALLFLPESVITW